MGPIIWDTLYYYYYYYGVTLQNLSIDCCGAHGLCPVVYLDDSPTVYEALMSPVCAGAGVAV